MTTTTRKTIKKKAAMNRRRNDYRYSQFSTIGEVLAEKARLKRKIKKQEKRLERDWERIEDGWRIFGKISQYLSSSLLMKSLEIGFNFVSKFFQDKR